MAKRGALRKREMQYREKQRESSLHSRAYNQLWRVVDGGVSDALKMHPDYLTPKGQRSARTSIVKRVTGTVIGFAEQSAKGRSDAAETEASGSQLNPPAAAPARAEATEAALVPSPPIFRVRIGKVRLKDRRYHTRKFPEFDRTTSDLLAAVKRQRV